MNLKNEILNYIQAWCRKADDSVVPTSNVIGKQLDWNCGTQDIMNALQQLANEGKIDILRGGAFIKLL